MITQPLKAGWLAALQASDPQAGRPGHQPHKATTNCSAKEGSTNSAPIQHPPGPDHQPHRDTINRLASHSAPTWPRAVFWQHADPSGHSVQ